MKLSTTRRMAAAALAAAVAPHVCAGADDGAERIEEVVVRAEASVAERHGGAGSVAAVAADAVERTRAVHPNEVLVRVPGVWIARGSGQEHLTAIRSGVLAGPGACGGFLLLENGVPIRPAGFCNINNLFEMNTEQADAIEVVRGPASALFGGNALHGAVNAVTRVGADGWRASIESGPYRYRRGRLSAGGERWRIDAASTDAGGYRRDTGYGQHKLNAGFATAAGPWRGATTLAATLLNQETGGYLRGFAAYDSPRRRDNPNPEAYRDAWSLRAASAWQRAIGERDLSLTAYGRRSGMAFLQHFLPGQPRENNAQSSIGVSWRLSGAPGADRARWSAGGVLEGFDALLSERQESATEGSPFLRATRPAGTHYDYRVRGATLAAFYDADVPLAATDFSVVSSARAELNRYAYDNRHLVGNSRDDGSDCGFGGCLYTRPADRDDAFRNLAGRIGIAWNPAAQRRVYAVAGFGFRPPQTTELYRLQRGQQVAELDSETLRALEAGMQWQGDALALDLAVYAQRARNLIFRDASGFNVGDGRTRSAGIEAQLVWRPAAAHTLDAAVSYARHRYDFTRDAARGERIARGNAVDSAPEWLGSARWHWQRGALSSEFELVHVGAHALDAANTARYGGHALLHWRGAWQTRPGARLFARMSNLLDAAYAERADYAFGSYRYFPGMPRQVYLGVEFGTARGAFRQRSAGSATGRKPSANT